MGGTPMDAQMAAAFRSLPYGIYVLMTGRGKDAFPTVVSWVSQVSYAPPLLMVALRRTRKAVPGVRENGFFSLNLLSAQQKSSVANFKTAAGPAAETAEPFPLLDSGQDGVPFIKDGLASFACRVSSIVESGDHLLFIGEV